MSVWIECAWCGSSYGGDPKFDPTMVMIEESRRRVWRKDDVANMRERAAKHLEQRAEEFESATEHHIGTAMALIYREEADRVRNLPIDPETGGE